MKKHFLIILVALLWCNVGVAGPKYDEKSLNKNILEYGWKVKSVNDDSLAIEIYTLTKDKWILICTVERILEIKTYCALP